ncbi:alpha-1,2-fucosyltransferase [Desulfuromonas sp. TF]|uniref:alpha-1,2-fucosyltransferase n=1 Tax=Desulfuromonas sp. TF TaxID=1232410 RepID=UPI0003F80A00|nr:alpha-1,2-fucosyltransferase [Desulfuromonas sp. TF]
MIIVRLMGGLGNQMFQYAAARRLALQHDAELAFDSGYFAQAPPEDTPRRYELGHLGIRARFAGPDEVAELSGRCRDCWQRMRLHLRRLSGFSHYRSHIVKERTGRFDPEVLTLPDNVYLQGYWHSERYFNDQAEIIRRELAVRTPLVGQNLELSKHIGRVDAVAVHVRRGDYATSGKTRAFHGLLSPSYYANAMSALRAQVTDPHIFVFSDDSEWVANHLRLDVPTTYVNHNPPDRGHLDMQLMSLCRHAIIANSSFSWWGAWLIDNPDKVVVAPQRWFAEPDRQTADLLPAGWLQVAND